LEVNGPGEVKSLQEVGCQERRRSAITSRGWRQIKKKKWEDSRCSQFKNNCIVETWSGSEEDSYLRLLDFCITQLQAREYSSRKEVGGEHRRRSDRTADARHWWLRLPAEGE